MKSFYFIHIFLSFVILLTACRKEENPVPKTPINVLIYSIESNPIYSDLRIEGNAAIVVKPNECLGYKCNGVILYRYKSEGTYDDFKAYDLTCTYEGGDCAMKMDDSFTYLVTCPCCGSVYNLQGGYMEKGPAKFPLREFNCSFSSGDLSIY